MQRRSVGCGCCCRSQLRPARPASWLSAPASRPQAATARRRSGRVAASLTADTGSSGSTQQQTASRANTTLSSLDNMLGSTDEDDRAGAVGAGVAADAAGAPVPLLRVPLWAWRELSEPRSVPLVSNALYYTLLLVFVSYYAVQLGEGQEMADDLLARLVNDHTAVADGDTLRLFTSFFVTSKLQALLVSLVGLATFGAELESLVGAPTWWAVWSLTLLTGSLSDAAFSALPITAGPAAGVGGIAAALLAHHLHNWRLEELVLQAREGEEVPQSLLQLESYYARKLRRQAQRDAAAAADAAAASGSSSSSLGGLLEGAESPRADGPRLAVDEGDVPTLIEGPLGLTFTALLPREGKAFITLAGTAVAVIFALQEAADAEATTDYLGLVAGFVSGGLIGWFACPVYALEMIPASSRRLAAGDAGGPDAAAAAAAPPDLLLPVLHDVRPGAARANAVIGFAGGLFAALGAWLLNQGVL